MPLFLGLVVASTSCTNTPSVPELISLTPNSVRGNSNTDILIEGNHFEKSAVAIIEEKSLVLTVIDASRGQLMTPRLARGTYSVRVQTQYGLSNSLALKVNNSKPSIVDPGPQLIEAGKLLELTLEASDFDGDTVTIEVRNKPEAATWDAANNKFTWQTLSEDADQNISIILIARDGEDETELQFTIQVVLNVPRFTFETISPQMNRGNEAFNLRIEGTNFTNGDVAYIGTNALVTTVENALTINAEIPPQKRGFYDITVHRESQISEPLKLQILNSTPTLLPMPAAEISEETEFSQTFSASDFDGDEVRLHAYNLPSGARFNSETQTINFTPDFIQGNQTHEIIIAATDGQETKTTSLTLTILDTIHPPWPTITSTEVRSDHIRLRLSQDTDDYLESPTEAGRSYDARVVIPDAATATNPLPVRVYLHGFGGSPYNGGAGDQFRIYPADPDNTYWWGHQSENTSPNYTQRRVLHLIEWLLEHYPSADPNRVYVTGPSMGGAGAAELGLLYARHFSHVESSIGQMIARNHRPSRVQQLSNLWGSPEDNFDSGNGIGAWDRQDLTRALRDEYDAQNQFIYTKHGKDDPTIHFGAVTHASPQTMYSFYEAVQAYRIGHFVVWDEGGHGSADPQLGNNWWQDDWSRSLDETTFLQNNLAFPAFTNSSADRDPGNGNANGQQTWNDTRGYAGTVATAGDTGWNGELAGTFNRYFRWDSRAILDTWERLEIPIRVKIDTTGAPPSNMYPPSGDKYFGPLPISADVTLRRVQAFHCKPGEPVTWSYGTQSGIIRADKAGILTILGLELSQDYQPLILVRTED